MIISIFSIFTNFLFTILCAFVLFQIAYERKKRGRTFSIEEIPNGDYQVFICKEIPSLHDIKPLSILILKDQNGNYYSVFSTNIWIEGEKFIKKGKKIEYTTEFSIVE